MKRKGTAGVLTTTFGEAYIVVLKGMVQEHGLDNIDPTELARKFKEKIVKKGRKK